MSSTSNRKIKWTNSRAVTARDCLRKHKLRYIDGWRLRPTEESAPLALGSLAHVGLESWWQNCFGLFRDDLERCVLEAMRKRPARTELEQIRAEEWVRAYHRRWFPVHHHWFPLHIEWEWVCDMPNPDTSGNSKTWELAGKFDVLAKYVGPTTSWIENETIWNIEHKTTAEDVSDGSEYWARRLMDSQISQYEVGGLANGYEIAGTIMDVGRKAGIRPLKKTKNIRQKKTETEAEFEERCRVEAPPETLEQFRDRLAQVYDEGEYFNRKIVPRTTTDLEEYLRDTWSFSTFIKDAMRQGIAPKNPDACHRMGKCEFFEHCAYGVQLETDMRFMKDDWPHPELRRPDEVIGEDTTQSRPART